MWYLVCVRVCVCVCVISSVPQITSLAMVELNVGGTLVPAVDPVRNLSSLSTEGGDVISITGTSFGPSTPRSYVSAVWYSNVQTVYSVSNCTFVEQQTQLQCISVPGVGVGMFAQVRSLGLQAQAVLVLFPFLSFSVSRRILFR